MNTTTIKFWSMANSGFESRKYIDQEIESFQKQNPAIQVESEILSWSRAWPKIINALKERSGPDVIQVGTTWIGTLGYLKAVKSFDEFNFDESNFIPPFINVCKYFDKLWAIPWFCEGRVLFYRKDMLAEAGLDPTAINTWAQFRTSCAAIKKIKNSPNIAPLGFSGQKEQVVLHDLACFIWGNGGSFVTENGKHSALDTPESREGIKFFLDLILSKFISKASFEQSTGEVAHNYFKNDSFAFLMSSSWPMQVYLNPNSKQYIGKKEAKKFGITLIPAGPFGRFNFAGGSALGITSFSRHPEESFSFIQHLTGKKSMNRYCKNIRMLSPRKDVGVKLTTTKEFQSIFDQSINKYGRSFDTHPLWGSMEQIIVDGISDSLKGLRDSKYESDLFFMHEINQEIEYMLSIFGE